MVSRTRLILRQLTIGSYVSVRSSRYEARGKFGEHERCVRAYMVLYAHCYMVYNNGQNCELRRSLSRGGPAEGIEGVKRQH